MAAGPSTFTFGPGSGGPGTLAPICSSILAAFPASGSRA